MKRVSVIIPMRDRKDYIDYCLTAFLSQTYPQSKFEIILVDDGSTDQCVTSHLENKWLLPLKVIHNNNSLGAGLARHEGIKASAGEIIIFTDADMIVPKHFIAAHAAYHQERDNLVITSPYRQSIYTKLYPADLKKVLVKKMLQLEPQLQQHIPANFAEQDQAINLFSTEDVLNGRIASIAALLERKRNSDFLEKYGNDLRNCPVPWITFITYSASLTKKTYEQSGGFDPDIRFRHSDRALGYKLHTQGLTFICDSTIVPIHQQHPRHQDMDTWLVEEYKTWLAKYPVREIYLFGLRLLDKKFKNQLLYSQLNAEINHLKVKDKLLVKYFDRWIKNWILSLFSIRTNKIKKYERILAPLMKRHIENNQEFKHSAMYQTFSVLSKKIQQGKG